MFLLSLHLIAQLAQQLAQIVLSEQHAQQPVSAHQEGAVVIWSLQLLAHQTLFLQHTNRVLFKQAPIFMRSLRLLTMLSSVPPICQPNSIVCQTQMHKPQVLSTMLQEIMEPLQLLQIHPLLLHTFATTKLSTIHLFTHRSSPQ